MLWLSYGAFLVPLWLSSGWIMGLFGGDTDDVGFVWLLLLYVWLAVAGASPSPATACTGSSGSSTARWSTAR